MNKNKTVKINGVLITPETQVKVVRFDQEPKNKKKFKLLDLNEEVVLEIIDFYRDLYICLDDGSDMRIESKNIAKVLNLLKVSKELEKTLNIVECIENTLSIDLQNIESENTI